MPDNATVKVACRAILAGDIHRAGRELGIVHGLRVCHYRAITGCLRWAAKRYNAPHLADYTPFDL